jgi:hypothetical protein
MNIYEKLIEVRKTVPYLQKENKGHQYQYVGSSQVLSAVRAKMDAMGLLLIPSVKSHTVNIENANGRTTYFTELEMDFIWVNAEKPDEKITCPWYGQGIDIAGEKGVGKALTYAEKYFMLKSFNIATDKDDPDAFQEANGLKESAPKRESKPVPPPAAAPPRAPVAPPAPKPVEEPHREERSQAPVNPPKPAGDSKEPDWKAFWSVVRPLKLGKTSKDEQAFIYREASSFFGCEVANSLTEVPDLDNAMLQQFAEYLSKIAR